MKATIDNDEFVTENFSKLIKKYPHQHIVICNGEIFTGKDAVQCARLKYPKLTPLWLPVPGPESFPHHLL